MSIQDPEAGPSVTSSKRVAHFDDTSEDEAEGSGSNSPKTPNGHARHDSRPNGFSKTNGTASRRKEKSRERLEDRARSLLPGRQQLPFYQGSDDIIAEIMANDTTIIIGETGCGKSTQLPQLLRSHPVSKRHYKSQEPLSKSGRPMIAVTQPRRLPTIALAGRVAEEMGCHVGDEVGYTVRFEDATSKGTRIRYMTEGVLMRELANGDRLSADRTGPLDGPIRTNGEEQAGGPSHAESINLLLQYDIIIIDEAHERTLNTDFLCGALKRVQRIRRDLVLKQNQSVNGDMSPRGGRDVRELKIVLMSATLDPAKFCSFFEVDRPALLVQGRIYDVATRYALSPVDDFIEAAATSALKLHRTPDAQGDILMFMPGAEEIENCCELLNRAAAQLDPEEMKLQILPLYAALPPSAQARIFAPLLSNTRRVVIATNIAETSITIPGVAYVVDAGYRKEKDYIFRNSGAIEHLKRKSISQASAWQRTGRAGRERSGECYRLYTKDAFNGFAEFDVPEIQRCNLASAVLQLIAMGLNPFEFEYIDNPGRDPISAAFQTLAGLEAISSATKITPLGTSMLFYPLDPSHARILIASFELGCASEIIDILSLINSGPVWIDRASDRENAAQARLKHLNQDGDHLTALNVFRAYLAIRDQNQGMGKWCKDNHVNKRTLDAALKIRTQLIELAIRDGRRPEVTCGTETSLVIRALLRGLFMNTAVVQADGTYRQTAGSLTVKIHPSSVLMSKRVPAIVYDELTITSQIYARNVSAFDQSWLTDIPCFRQLSTQA